MKKGCHKLIFYCPNCYGTSLYQKENFKDSYDCPKCGYTLKGKNIEAYTKYIGL